MDGQTIPRSDDRTAIHDAIEAETKAYVAKDYSRWSSCWLQSERTCEIITSGLGTFVHRGWDEVSSAMAKVMEDDPEPLPLPFRHVDFRITVIGDIAWATFLSTCQVTGDERFDMPDAFETRVLERHQGEWLIVYLSVLSLRSGPVDRTRIRVDDKGHVIWAPNATLDALRDHPSLTVSAGRLRATRPAWDKVLQDAVRRAAQLHHLCQIEDSPAVSSQVFVFPVVLGEDEDGGVQSCIVYVRDGGTYVSFDDGREIDRQLEIAKVIFALSDGQARLARRIVAGRGLTDAAADLGISINTARTHLGRIYDKTGVNSQPALVRVLLSAGSYTG